MPFDHDQIDNLDAVIDGLDAPSTLETWQGTDAYDAGMVAASAVRRSLAGGGGGGSAWNVVEKTSDDSPYTASASNFVAAGDNDGGLIVHLPESPAAGTQVSVWSSRNPDEGVTVDTTDETTINGNASVTLNGVYDQLTVIFDGDEWAALVPAFTEDAIAALLAGTSLELGSVTLDTQATAGSSAPQLSQLSPAFTITGGTLPQSQLVSGDVFTADAINDKDVYTPVTFDASSSDASCQVELAPNGSDWTTLFMITVPHATMPVDGLTLPVNVRVPGNWDIRLTCVNATLGLSTVY